MRVARIECKRCGSKGEVTGGGEDFPIVLRKFRHMGWTQRQDGLICPTCSTRPAKPHDSPKLVQTAKQETVAMPSITPMPTRTSQPEQPMRQPTFLEVRSIMGLLEEHFDGAKGAYSNGWSDEKVSQEANVPRAIVAKIRDDAFGKIKSDPEIMAIRAEIDAVQDRMVKLSDYFRGEQEKLLAQVAGLSERADKLERRIAGAA
jgi:hypothetical protein